MTAKPALTFSAFLLVLILIAGLYYVFNAKNRPEKPLSPPKDSHPETVTSNTLPESFKITPQILDYQLENKTFERVDATLTKIVTPESTFVLHLDTNQDVTVKISNTTTLFKASYDVNPENGTVEVTHYTPIAKSDLAILVVGKKIRLTVEKKLLETKNTIIATEFVVLED